MLLFQFLRKFTSCCIFGLASCPRNMSSKRVPTEVVLAIHRPSLCIISCIIKYMLLNFSAQKPADVIKLIN